MWHTTFLTAGDQPVVATCGGFDDQGNDLSSCLVLNPSTGQWEENRMGPVLQKRSGHAAVTLDRHVYLIGGGEDETSPSSTTTELLAAGSTTWQQGPPLPVEMFNGPCAVAISSTSFLVFYDKKIREFDASIAGPTSGEGWVKEMRWPKLEIDRALWPACAKVGKDKLVIVGGIGDGTVRTTEILDLTSR